MKIHITKAGRNIIVCFAIGIALFFMFGGGVVVAKLLEKHRVRTLPDFSEDYSNFNDWQALSDRHAEVTNALRKANDLQNAYPDNAELKSIIHTYQNHLVSIENHRVGYLLVILKDFSNSDISYNSWKTLKKSFSDRHAEITDVLRKAKDLQKAYPDNVELKSKIRTYQNYLESMGKALFDCPEHINTGTQLTYVACSKCNGKGKRYKIWKCKECKGEGRIAVTHEIKIKCPHCGEIYKSQILAKSLLN
ncbi:MAG: hypothetical protein GX561_04190 [Lentisphaerae bacterium]|jgi:hypothetical protein|nr:hypothetical protein [Lentisphaerota bacterium]